MVFKIGMKVEFLEFGNIFGSKFLGRVYCIAGGCGCGAVLAPWVLFIALL
jgi:hypothetical protein